VSFRAPDSRLPGKQNVCRVPSLLRHCHWEHEDITADRKSPDAYLLGFAVRAPGGLALWIGADLCSNVDAMVSATALRVSQRPIQLVVNCIRCSRRSIKRHISSSSAANGVITKVSGVFLVRNRTDLPSHHSDAAMYPIGLRYRGNYRHGGLGGVRRKRVGSGFQFDSGVRARGMDEIKWTIEFCLRHTH
jgi:hypothetical protein